MSTTVRIMRLSAPVLTQNDNSLPLFDNFEPVDPGLRLPLVFGNVYLGETIQLLFFIDSKSALCVTVEIQASGPPSLLASAKGPSPMQLRTKYNVTDLGLHVITLQTESIKKLYKFNVLNPFALKRSPTVIIPPHCIPPPFGDKLPILDPIRCFELSITNVSGVPLWINQRLPFNDKEESIIAHFLVPNESKQLLFRETITQLVWSHFKGSKDLNLIDIGVKPPHKLPLFVISPVNVPKNNERCTEFKGTFKLTNASKESADCTAVFDSKETQRGNIVVLGSCSMKLGYLEPNQSCDFELTMACASAGFHSLQNVIIVYGTKCEEVSVDLTVFCK